LRSRTIGISIAIGTTRRRTEPSIETPLSLFRFDFVSDRMEGAMKCLATAAGAFLAAILLMPGAAQAGASSSAPSKYAQSRQPAVVHQAREARRPSGFAITEYSSSSAKTTTSPKR
jgi:hypothetical protein